MDIEEERMCNETAAQLLQEVSLPLATEHVAVSSLRISLAMLGPSVINTFTPQRNGSEGTPISVPQFIFQIEQMTPGGFTGFNFRGNFSSTSRLVSIAIPYPGLDGHTRRITPIPISAE